MVTVRDALARHLPPSDERPADRVLASNDDLLAHAPNWPQI